VTGRTETEAKSGRKKNVGLAPQDIMQTIKEVKNQKTESVGHYSEKSGCWQKLTMVIIKGRKYRHRKG